MEEDLATSMGSVIAGLLTGAELKDKVWYQFEMRFQQDAGMVFVGDSSLHRHQEQMLLEAKPQRTAHWWFLCMVLAMLAVAVAALADSMHEQTKVCYEPMQEQPTGISYK